MSRTRDLTYRPFRRRVLVDALRKEREKRQDERDELVKQALLFDSPPPEISARISRLSRLAAETAKQIRALYGGKKRS